MIPAAHQTMLAPQVAPYRLLDYIKGGGAQFIDTGYKITPSDTIEFEIALSTITSGSDLTRFIGRVNRPTIVYQVSAYNPGGATYTSFQYFKDTTGKQVQTVSQSNAWLLFRADASTKYLTLKDSSGTVLESIYVGSEWPSASAPESLFLFRRYDVTTCFDGYCRRFTVEGKHDWRAALDPNGRPCMVDLIDPANPAYLYNGGTGEFTPGPDKT